MEWDTKEPSSKNPSHDYGLILVKELTESLTDGIIMLGQEGQVITYNSVAERILGIPSEKVIGQSYERTIGELLPIKRKVRTTKNKPKTFEFDFRGSKCRVVIRRLDDPIGILVRMTDLTEQMNLESQLISQSRLATIGTLASGLAHEIRNPMTTILGFMQLMVNSNDYSKAENFLPLMYDELLRVKELISDFVAVSKPVNPEKTHIEIKKLVEETIKLMSAQATLNGVELESDLSKLQGTIFADGRQIKQVLINIIKNALEASIGEGSVLVKGQVGQTTCTLTIVDTGVGMTKEQVQKMLTPFYTTKSTGTGLGLPVCRGIIESHGGKMSFLSKEGKGTRVDVRLPLK